MSDPSFFSVTAIWNRFPNVRPKDGEDVLFSDGETAHFGRVFEDGTGYELGDFDRDYGWSRAKPIAVKYWMGLAEIPLPQDGD